MNVFQVFVDCCELSLPDADFRTYRSLAQWARKTQRIETRKLTIPLKREFGATDISREIVRSVDSTRSELFQTLQAP